MMNNNFPDVQWPGWETVDTIGRGSFGTVYKIQRDVLGETEVAAMKMISIPQSTNDIDEMISEGADAESITSTFRSYLRSIVSEYSLMHKMKGCVNVVSCDDVRYVQHADGIGWDIFIKMELLTPLTKTLPQEYVEEIAIRVARDICKALILCQKNGIVHRDIKPQNIFVSDNGDYKLGDFGVAKIVEETAGGTVIGSYKYMAPEVYNNKPYNNTVDIYSLGLLLYWLMNERRLPFLPLPPERLNAEIDKAARDKRFAGEPIPDPVNGSADLKRIVLKACAFNSKDRYQSAQEMLEDLNNLKATNTVTRRKKFPLIGVAGAVAAVVIAAVLLLGGPKKNKLEILTQPSVSSVKAGQELVVEVKAAGEDLQYQWMLAQPGSNKFKQTGRNSPELFRVADMDLDGCKLYCVITDEKGNSVTTDEVTLDIVHPITITEQPVDVTVNVGEQAVLSVKAEGKDLRYRWWYAEKSDIEFRESSITGETYVVEMDEVRDGRKLYCEITDADGNTLVSNTVVIKMFAPAKIVTQPQSVEAALGEKIAVTVEATGDNLKYEWYFKDTEDNEFAKTDAFTGNSYSVEMDETRDGRQLYCVVTAEGGSSAQSDTVTIKLKPIVIKKQPESVIVANGEITVVQVEAIGRDLKYCWWVMEKGETIFQKSSITEAVYTTKMDEARDGRQLYCEITDAKGNTMKTEIVTITMIKPIMITSQPKDAVAAEGETVEITVKAEGKKLTYEWYYKNTSEAKFTKTDSFTGNTYTVEMDAKRNGRQLYCIIKDAEGNQVQTDTVTIKLKK